MIFDFFKRRNDKFFWVFDIGTEAVKALIVKREGIGIAVFGAAVQYFDQYGFFGGQDPAEIILKKAVSKAIEEALQRFSVASKSEAEKRWKKWPVFLGLSPDVLKARVCRQSFERQKPKEKISRAEERRIRKKYFEAVKSGISIRFAEETGILAEDIRWLRFATVEEKIDGYPVRNIAGLSGTELEFKVLAVFLGGSYFENIGKILAGLGLKISKIIHISENLFSLPVAEKSDSIFFDAGGDIVQFFLIREGLLEEIGEIKTGGRFFSRKLSDALGVSEESARILKEKYSKNGLSGRSIERVREIFQQEKGYWARDLELGFEETGRLGAFPADVFIFGGASESPEIRDILSAVSGLPPGEAKIVYPKDLGETRDLTKILDSPQYTPSLLIAKSANIG